MRALVTGISGFTGPYVRAALEARGHEVYGIAEHTGHNSSDEAVDLLDVDAIEACLARKPVDCVLHLAGISFVAHGRAADQYRINLLGTLNLLEAIWSLRLPVRKIVLASSAYVYGRPASVPVSESMLPSPAGHYAVSKYAMELMARTWFDRLPILIGRPFNYTGIGQSEKFVLPKLVKHFRDRTPEIELGDTSVVREFMDVRDVAAIYARLVESDSRSDVVNICSGIGHRLESVIDTLRSLSGFAPKLKTSPALIRENEIAALTGSPARLHRITGPIAYRPLEETLGWMLKG